MILLDDNHFLKLIVSCNNNPVMPQRIAAHDIVYLITQKSL